MKEDVITIENDPSALAQPTKRFFRTFESDAAAVKEGNAADFTAANISIPTPPPPAPHHELNSNEIDISDTKTNEPSVIEDLSIPTPPEEPPRALQAADRLIGGSPLPPPTTLPPIEVEVPKEFVPPPPDTGTKPTPIHTYTSDFAAQMADTSASTATILAAESNARREVPITKEKNIAINAAYIVSGLLLLMLGAGGVYGVYTYISDQMGSAVLTPTISAPIFVNEREKIDGEGPKLLQAIEQSVGKPLAVNTVRFLYTVSATSTGDDIFRALQFPAPDILLRNITSKDSMAGIVNAGGTSAPFFIISVSSYSDTFAGMLAWEPKMAANMATLFPHDQVAVATSTASSTPAIPPVATFKDEVIENHDVRVLRNPSGTSVLLYGYWNPHTLVLARDEKAFTEIIGRLATSKTQK